MQVRVLSVRLKHMLHSGIEQLAAYRAHNPKVGGSSPPPAITFGQMSELVYDPVSKAGAERIESSSLSLPTLVFSR